MKITTKQLTITALMIALCIVSTFLKSISVYITGPIVNACIIITAVYAGPVCACILSVIVPVVSFLVGNALTAAVPLIMLFIMLGNAILGLTVALLKDKFGKLGLPVSMVIGSILKFAFMGIFIALIIIPNMLPEAMAPKMSTFQMMMSVVQLTTALIGSVYAYVIMIALKKIFPVKEQ